jgi:uncharacterized membrane protein YfcA
MAESLWTWVLLCLSAFLGGAVNSIAGGGTLLTFPSLLTVLSPVAANATSTMALLPGSLAAAWGYRGQLAESRRHVVRLWPSSFVGGLIGSLLVIRLPERVFAGLVPWLLVTASTLLLVQRPLVRWVGAHPHEAPRTRTLVAIIVFQLAVGIYGGYFGAGIGILMLSSLAFVGIPHIHQMNGVKNLLAASINGITAVIFVTAGVIVWKYAVAMAVFAIAGGYSGARVAQKLPVGVVRAIVVTIGFAVAAYSWFGRR